MSFSALLRLWLVHLFCVAGLVGLRRHLLLKPGQLWQSGEISGGQRHDEAKPCAFNAAINGLDGASDGFGPAESLLDPFAVPEGTSVALVPGERKGRCGKWVRRNTSGKGAVHQISPCTAFLGGPGPRAGVDRPNERAAPEGAAVACHR